MSLYSEPKNGDFASYVETLSSQALIQMQKDSLKAKKEHERHASGQDINKIADASIKAGSVSNKIPSDRKNFKNSAYSLGTSPKNGSSPAKRTCEGQTLLGNKNAPFLAKVYLYISLAAIIIYLSCPRPEEFNFYVEFVPLVIMSGYMLFAKITMFSRFIFMNFTVALVIFNLICIIQELYTDLFTGNSIFTAVAVYLWIKDLFKKED